MKKMFCILMVAMFLMTSAVAECVCSVDSMVRMTAYEISTMDYLFSKDELSALSEVFCGDIHDCQEVKVSLLHLILRDYDGISSKIGEIKLDALLAYISHCGCCGKDVKADELPAQPSTQESVHYHYGGSHENNGVCRGCGYTYQNHKMCTVSINNSQHQQLCECGWKGQTENHKPGSLQGISSNGLGIYTCTVCEAKLYWYMTTETHASCDCCKCNNK